MLINNGYKSKQRSSAPNCRIQVLVMSFTLMLMLVIFFLIFDNVHDDDNDGVEVKVKSSLDYVSHKQKWNSFDSLVKLHPTREFRNGTDLIWQVPESPKGVLFLAHGCNGKAINFWDKSTECPNCIGLPEERLLVLHGLAQGFAVITISSAHRCWSFGKEVLVVKDILKWWIGKRKLEKLPLVALGASSGGYFVSLLATAKKFNSIVLMIAEGMFEEIDINQDYPPTLFEQNAGVTARGYFKPLSKLIGAEIYSFEVPFSVVYNVQFLTINEMGKSLRNKKINSYYKGFPVFGNLTYLRLCWSEGIHDWDEVVKMLKNCPKLQALTISKSYDSTTIENWKYPDQVPGCVTSHLTTCEIEDYEALEADFRFASYILQNARLLQVMTIWRTLNPKPMESPQFFEDLSSFPAISPTCKLKLR